MKEAVVAFLLSLAVFPLYIRWLKSKQFGQFIREEGPQTHAAKAKTPTMGGLAFIAVSTITACGFLFYYWYQLEQHKTSFVHSGTYDAQVRLLVDAFAVIGIGALCGLVGFADDYAKVTSRSNKGLPAKTRLLIEFALGALLSAIIYFVGIQLDLVLNPGDFAGTTGPQLFSLVSQPILNAAFLLILVPFIVAATTNAFNLHDGMDGLAAGTAILVFSSIGLMTIAAMTPVFAIIAYCLVGALAGFLIFNKYPAKVFMGDTGSLYIGGVLAALIVTSGLTLWFVPLALIYIAETLSVMAQVIYFKLTKPYQSEPALSTPALVWLKLTRKLPGQGKRLFRMAPLHHHFEAIAGEKGIPEWQVVSWFWLAQLIVCISTVLAYLALGAAATSGVAR